MFFSIIAYNIDATTFLLDNGADPCTRSEHWTVLGWAVYNGLIETCILLLSRGADLADLGVNGEHTMTLDLYNDRLKNLTQVELEQDKMALRNAFANGPHPSQRQLRWTRRWPVMLFVAGCRFRPLAGKQGWIPPPEGLSLEQRIMARRRSLVFSSDLLLRLIVSFL